MRYQASTKVWIRAYVLVAICGALTYAPTNWLPRALSAAAEPTVSSSLKVPDAHALVFEATVIQGVQTYGCAPEHKYALVGPTALLRTKAGELVVHYGGPSWQYQDGSSIVGKALAHEAAPNAVDELLIQVVQHGARQGRFDSVDYIQRLATTGGVAPTSCDPASASTLVVPYSATYLFWAPNK